jgi:Glutamine synthetase
MASLLSTPSTTGSTGFVARHRLWDEQRREAAADLERKLDSLDAVRVVFADPHGIARSKTLSVRAFRSVLRNGMDFSPGPFLFDTGHALAVDPFAPGGGIGLGELDGAGDFIVVPDPLTFTVLPYTGRPTGWVVGDEYLRDGTPHPLSSRAVLRRLCDRLPTRGMEYVVGLEVEWYLTRYTDGARPRRVGGFGVQGVPPEVEPVNGGYQFNSDSLLDALEPVLAPLVDTLITLDLPLRTIEHESGPGQLEFTFDPMNGMAAADAMLLFRTVTKQVLARSGYHASFMALPRLPGFDASGWHLHQSLADRTTGRDLFSATVPGEVLSDLGMRYLGGLLHHAAGTMLLCVPTINGFRRMNQNFALAPTRVDWSTENRGVFLRVLGAHGDPASHIENRAGEPSANPYLYLAAQLAAGLDGIDGERDPGAPVGGSCATTQELPRNLAEAIGAFEASTLSRAILGDALSDCLRLLKASELARFEEWLANIGSPTAGPRDDAQVSEWEHCEYFAAY